MGNNPIGSFGKWLRGDVWRPIEKWLYNFQEKADRGGIAYAYQEAVDEFVGSVVGWNPAELTVHDRAASLFVMAASLFPARCGSSSNSIDSKSWADALPEEALEDCAGPSSKCPSLCLDEDYYICDEFEGEEGIETDIWKVSVKGEGISHLIDGGYLTISGSKDGMVNFSSMQPQSLYEGGALVHSIETKVKLEGATYLYLSDGPNGCVVWNADDCAMCGGKDIYESDACPNNPLDTAGWHTYTMVTAADANGKPAVSLYQDGVNKITEVPAKVEYGKDALNTTIGCLTYANETIGSCQFDYVRGMKSDIYF